MAKWSVISRLLSSAVLVVVLAVMPAAAQPADVFRVGVVLDGPGEWDEAVLKLFIDEIRSVVGDKYEIQFPPDKILTGDWTTAGVDREVTRLLHDGDIDMLLALGFMASHRFCCRIDIRKPVVAAFVIDRKVQNLPFEGTGSGRPFLNYVASPAPIERDLRSFRDVVGFDKVTVVIGLPFIEAVPDLEAQFILAVKNLGLEIHILPIEQSAQDVLDYLKPSTRAVYLGPLLNLPTSEFDKLVEGLKAKNIPSFSLMGCREVDAGVMGGLRPRNQLTHRAHQVATNVLRILRGEDAGMLPIEFMVSERLCLNAKTAQKLGIELKEGLRAKAEMVDK